VCGHNRHTRILVPLNVMVLANGRGNKHEQLNTCSNYCLCPYDLRREGHEQLFLLRSLSFTHSTQHKHKHTHKHRHMPSSSESEDPHSIDGTKNTVLPSMIL